MKVENVLKKPELNFDESGVNSLNFFDTHGSESPNDEEGDPSNVEGSGRVSSDDSVHPVNEEDAATATQIDDTITSEGTSQNTLNGEDHGEAPPSVRRSTRQRSQPVRFNDFVVGSNVKYGLEKYVSYSNLSRVNMCFSFKGIEDLDVDNIPTFEVSDVHVP
ncbi:reverse transcriptase, RNA-dependent DNA polymerase, Gag-polypeptide of LTR copia-type [Artemisia annua]|uniref:Reverse transcriptase, RNA-dependent DNA polymerase, Gag-polypeptide of LTR copia-type n=1 Tax=Artemisia annua TaxID=35608 RepID=A0A2U1LZC1_ARTAN|nr:reverse transcriptase, RNA-dependent DNA polymerase, Gag-polypeptide of LTR copia-type [Artemisia annua]